MSDSIDNLSACTTPVRAADVFNPTRPNYYLKDEMDALAKSPVEDTSAQPTVQITLSNAAQAVLAGK